MVLFGPQTATQEPKMIRTSDTLGLVLELVDELVDAADHDARLALGRLLYAHGGHVLGQGDAQVLGRRLIDLLLLGLHDVGQRRVPG